MLRATACEVALKCPADFAPMGARPLGIIPLLLKVFLIRHGRAMTDNLIQQVKEFVTPSTDSPGLLDRVHVGLAEAVAICSRVHEPGTPIRAILIQQEYLLQGCLTFVVDCQPRPGTRVFIPNPEDVPPESEIGTSNLRYLGYRRMMNATDGLDVRFDPGLTLIIALSFLDPRP